MFVIEIADLPPAWDEAQRALQTSILLGTHLCYLTTADSLEAHRAG